MSFRLNIISRESISAIDRLIGLEYHRLSLSGHINLIDNCTSYKSHESTSPRGYSFLWIHDVALGWLGWAGLELFPAGTGWSPT